MNKIPENQRVSNVAQHGCWDELAAAVLDGHRLTATEGLAILRADDDELLDLLAAAYRVRRCFFGNRVSLNFLINAKSGLCGEDCGYCAQFASPRPRFRVTIWSPPTKSSPPRGNRRQLLRENRTAP